MIILKLPILPLIINIMSKNIYQKKLLLITIKLNHCLKDNMGYYSCEEIEEINTIDKETETETEMKANTNILPKLKLPPNMKPLQLQQRKLPKLPPETATAAETAADNNRLLIMNMLNQQPKQIIKHLPKKHHLKKKEK